MNNVIYFAKTNFRGQERIFGIKEKDRLQHMYVIGQTGVGKTNLLKNLAIQDIKSGRGLAVIDPHGEFVEDLLDSIPSERAGDVIYFNPADIEYPIGFNVLEVKDPEQKHLVASGLMAIFTKIWAGVWSARMEYILNNCVLTLLDVPDATLMGLMRLLVDKNYRRYALTFVKDPVVKAFWLTEYEVWEARFRAEAIAPIQNKVGQFLSARLIRNIVGQPQSTLDLEKIVNEGKILLVNVSKGLVGEDNSALLGAMVITKLQLTAMERIRLPVEERKSFFLYVDEFQNFATDAFATILSESRKYGLALIIGHQYIGQLVTETSTRVRDAVFGNVGTLITFRVGATDGEFLEKQFAPEIFAQDLVNLPNYQIYLKLMVDGISSRPFSAITLPPIPLEKKEGIHLEIIERSRKNYAASRSEVEEMIVKWSESVEEAEENESFRREKKKIKVSPPVARPKEESVSLEELVNRPPETFKLKPEARSIGKKPVEPDVEGLRSALEQALKKQ